MVTKHKVETILVPDLDAAPATGNLYDANGTPLIAVGELGVYEVTDTTGNHTAVATPGSAVVANTPFWKMILRRDESMDTTPLPPRRYIETTTVDSSCKVAARATEAVIPNNNTWLVGAVAGTAGATPINDETEYIINCSMRGWNTDLYNGRNRPLKMGRFVTPDYSVSTFYTVAAQQVDHILGNLAFDFNNQSWTQAIALCLDSSGTVTGDNVQTLSTIAALPIGSIVIIGHKDDGQAIILTLDRDLIQTIQQMIVVTPALGAYNLVPYARNTAVNLASGSRTISGGRAVGGPNALVDHLVLLALDMKAAAYQEVPQNKERLLVGLDGGFDGTTTAQVVTEPEEGAGLGKDLLQVYNDFQSHKMYLGNKPWQQNHVNYPSEILTNAFYDIFIVEHCKARTASSGMPSVSPQLTMIAVVNPLVGDAVTNPFFEHYGAGLDNPMKDYVQDFLNSWIGSTNYPHTTIAI